MSNSPERSSARSEIPNNRMVERPPRGLVSDSSRGFGTPKSTNAAGVLAQRCPPTIQLLEQEREKIRREHPERRDPRNPKFPQPNIFLYITPEPKFPKNIGRLSQKELEYRRNLIREAIEKSRKYYPLAASQLTHWLDGKGGVRLIPKEIFDFTDLSCGVIHHLIKKQLPQFKAGAKKRWEDGRLVPGCSYKLWWQDGQAAAEVFNKNGKPNPTKEKDLAVAMHGFQLASEMEVMARVNKPGRIDIIAWKFQIYDSYDWIVYDPDTIVGKTKELMGAPAIVGIPEKVNGEDIKRELSKVPYPKEVFEFNTLPGFTDYDYIRVNDKWFLEVEKSEAAHWFDSFTEIFEVPREIIQRIN